MFEKFKKLEKPQRLSRLYGYLIGIGLFLILILVLDSIKITVYEIFTSPQGDFQIKYPADWQVVHKPGVEGVGFAVVGFITPRRNQLDAVQENVAILRQHVAEDLRSPEKFNDQMIYLASAFFKEYVEVLESVPITLGGLPGYRFTFAIRSKFGPSLLFSNAWVLVGDEDYMITFGGLEEDYPFFKKKFETMIKSFKFLKPEQQAAQP